MSQDLVGWVVLALSVGGLVFVAGWIMGGLHRDDKNLRALAAAGQLLNAREAEIAQLRENEIKLMDQWVAE